MTDTSQIDEEYGLSEDERKQIEHEEHLDKISEELSGYKLNSEMKKAWIDRIVPPIENEDKIKIKFILPSELISDTSGEEDVFWEHLNYPDEKRWPEDNEFRIFMESLGCYNPQNLDDLLGKEVEIMYSEEKERWKLLTQRDLVTDEFDSNSDEEMTEVRKSQAYEELISILILPPLVLIILLFIGVFRVFGVLGLFCLLAILTLIGLEIRKRW